MYEFAPHRLRIDSYCKPALPHFVLLYLLVLLLVRYWDKVLWLPADSWQASLRSQWRELVVFGLLVAVTQGCDRNEYIT